MGFKTIEFVLELISLAKGRIVFGFSLVGLYANVVLDLTLYHGDSIFNILEYLLIYHNPW